MPKIKLTLFVWVVVASAASAAPRIEYVACSEVQAYILAGSFIDGSDRSPEKEFARNGELVLQEVVGDPDLEAFQMRVFYYGIYTFGLYAGKVTVLDRSTVRQFVCADLDRDGSHELFYVTVVQREGVDRASLQVLSATGIAVKRSKYLSMYEGSLYLERKNDRLYVVGAPLLAGSRIDFRRRLDIDSKLVITRRK